ncbi:MAG TPA: hypothetical protein VFN28_16595 [Amaricoccus sp.]|nr:hypothetical protein [Amaricoccus sp.]
MPSRRTFLALTASLLGLPLAAAPAAALSGPGFGGFGDGPGALALGPRPEVRRYGRHFLVNGWVLTAEDLERLGLHAA